MPSTVNNISISYDAINESNTFTSGDFITGTIILELANNTEIKSLSVKAKGKTVVRWTEYRNKTIVIHHAKEKHFSILQHILQKQSGDNNVIVEGTHVYPFTFQIPHGDMPSSFIAFHGKVIYTLKAKLRQSMGLPSKAKTTFNFLSKPDMSIPQLMSPQYGTKSKKMMLFTSGNASINISTERMGYRQGEGLKVIAEIENSSSRALAPKYAIYQKQSFFARGEKRVSTMEILKEVGEPIPPSTNQKITKVLNIPPDLPISILKCPILKVEYKLKVYLDVPYATDPEIKVPLVILPAHGFSQVV
ncbi:arrestin domain-containing protein 3-like [Megalops cyprinoides]|uniref:arrestin domain-containing protein 3-like n=1 Tax=Megalops cyprinoides TaxID=118141 RepID=UPI0018654FBE|nr:arrestin domain-containing protein 3-like [Megalops cyprinoides]